MVTAWWSAARAAYEGQGKVERQGNAARAHGVGSMGRQSVRRPSAGEADLGKLYADRLKAGNGRAKQGAGRAWLKVACRQHETALV